MVFPEENERKMYKQFHDLCRSLNLDKSSAGEAWKAFIDIYDPYMLAGEPLHWMGCAIYVACKSVTLPTVSKSNVNVQGNLVNLKGLLKLIDLSIVDFFIKIRRWANFGKLSTDFLRSLDQLERDFTVSMVLFKKFQPIFNALFSENGVDYVKVWKNRKIKTNLIPVARIFDFSWTLFICVKSNYPKISDDLVSSYHLLLACFDFIFVNLFVSGRKDIIKSDFPLPSNMKTKCINLSDVTCILDLLCNKFDGISVEAKGIKEYIWRKHIKQMFEKKVLRGNASLLTDILELSHFEQNFKAVNKQYEEYVLSVGTFDERIFLGSTFNTQASDAYANKFGEFSQQLEAKRRVLHKETPMTPLTGRQYLNRREYNIQSNGWSVSTDFQKAAALQSIVGMRTASPSEYLQKIIDSCDPKPSVEEFVKKFADMIKEKYLEGDNVTQEHADKRIETVTKIFYKIMDSVLPEEIKKPTFDAKVLLNEEVFLKTLFACSFEIMAFLSSSSYKYPWISTAFPLPHYYFYKIIEVVVRHEDSLSRDVVKYLNTIEEKILDSYAWQRNSPLWKAIVDSGQGVPCCEDVSNRSTNVECTPTKQASEVDKLSALASKESSLTKSPGAPLADKFTLSPQRLAGVKRPNEDSAEGSSKLLRLESGAEAPANNLSNDKSSSPTQRASNEASNDKDCNLQKENKKPKRTGAVALFFRKFYYLAAVRMEDLCRQLNLTDVEVRKKIWTCFEETITKNVGLMLERHLDQMLMCSIYMICKVVQIQLQFTDIMKCYRNQPQATSDVYREALISPDLTLEDIKDPKHLEHFSKQERKDIIKFYNTVFVSKHKSLVKKLNASNDNDRIVLSPIPMGLCTPPTASRRISEKHSLFLRPFELESMPTSPASSQFSYKFSRSPAKDLKAINNMVSKAEVSCLGRRLLADDTTTTTKSSNYSLVWTRKVRGLYNDRISAGAQD